MPDWPADRVERRAVAALVPYARNARTHSDEQVAQIAASIREWGWTVPVLVDEQGGIIAGHGRVLAAQGMGLADVPCVVASGWSDEQRRAYVLADNQIALNAGWDRAMLGSELSDLAGLGVDMTAFGFPAEADGADDAAEIEDVGADRRFWIAVQGGLTYQAEALHALKELAKLPGVEVQSNLVG
jgi:ParB-like chromosome segregation protein Spo0J